MAAFWVVGGEYTDTRFAIIAPGRALERHGPFASYDAAHEVWAARAWATIDDCHARFQVIEGDDSGPGGGPVLAEGRPVR